MLYYDAGWRFELSDALERRIGVCDVVVGEFLTLDLGRCGQAVAGRRTVRVERCSLVRVLTVAQRRDAAPGVKEAFTRVPVLRGIGKIGADGRVVDGRVRVGLGCKPAPSS